LAFVTTLTLLPESYKPVEGGREQAGGLSLALLRRSLARPHLGLLLGVFFLATFGYANIYATFQLISVHSFGFTDWQVGLLFGLLGITGALTQGVLIRPLRSRFRERTLFVLGALTSGVGLALVPYYVSTSVLAAELILMALGTGMMTPSILSMISRAADPREQGGVLGLNQALGALGRALGPVWGTFAYQSLGRPMPFLTGGSMMLMSLLLVLAFLPAGALRAEHAS
jgi:predicted MFS family arabinose efflux permease